jgi:hypothetical protein
MSEMSLLVSPPAGTAIGWVKILPRLEGSLCSRACCFTRLGGS